MPRNNADALSRTKGTRDCSGNPKQKRPRSLLAHEPRQEVARGADGGRRGNREDPGPDDLARDAPAHSRQPARRADPDDGTGDGVGGADADAERGGGVDRDGRTGFGGKSP